MSLSIKTDVIGTSLATLCVEEIEQLLIRAYVKLVFMVRSPAGLRTAIVAQFGALEVRLTEISDAYILQYKPSLWIEIYSHVDHSITDSYGMFEFNEDELSQAVELIASFYLDAHGRQRFC